jgi:DNA-binding LytR/AlgR family response regulator
VLGRLAIRDRDGAKLVSVEDICYINTQGRKVILHTTSRTYATHYTLSELEHRLRAFRFFRANEGCLVNLDKVKEVVYEGPRTYELLLSCGEHDSFVPLSRSRTQKLRDLLDF